MDAGSRKNIDTALMGERDSFDPYMLIGNPTTTPTAGNASDPYAPGADGIVAGFQYTASGEAYQTGATAPQGQTTLNG